MAEGKAASWYKQTRGERDAHRNTLNLFFGALLGANLGTLGGIATRDYVYIVAMLLAAVSSLQLLTAARSRSYALLTLCLYGAALALLWVEGNLRPDGMAEADFDRLAATIGLWLGAIVVTEALPVIPDDRPPPTP